jgi:hypothetical protein
MSAGELLWENKKKEMLFNEKKINSEPALASVSAGIKWKYCPMEKLFKASLCCHLPEF